MSTLPPISSNQHSTVIQFMCILLNFHDPYELVTSYTFTLCKHINSQCTGICLEKLLLYIIILQANMQLMDGVTKDLKITKWQWF